MDAIERGLLAVRRHPTLLLIPLLWDVILLGLAYMGLPAGPGWPNLGADSPTGLRGFVPSALPSVANMQLPMAPALQAPLEQAGPLPALVVLLVLPVLSAGVMSLYLGLLGDAVQERPLSWRRALRSWPALIAVLLALRLAPLFFSTLVLLGGMVVSLALFPVLPFAVAVLEMDLWQALRESPALLWGRFKPWLTLGFFTVLVTVISSAVWVWLGRSPFLALLFYPGLATVLVGGAAAVTLYGGRPDGTSAAAAMQVGGPEEQVGRRRSANWLVLPALVAVVLLALLGARWMGAWTDWQPSRETALAHPVEAPFKSLFGEERHYILQVVQDGDHELVISRINEKGLTLTPVMRGRFGWRRLPNPVNLQQYDSGFPALFYVANLESAPGESGWRSNWFLVGEVNDPGIAFLQIGSARYPVMGDGSLFLIELPEHPEGIYSWLDKGGQRIQGGEVRWP